MCEVYRLVYASRSRLSERSAPSAIMDMLYTSRRNNASLDITGALFFDERTFAQVLEGDQRCVDQTFGRIKRDPRHGSVELLHTGPSADRGFADWSMAYVGSGGDGPELWKALLTASSDELSCLDGGAVFAMLRGLPIDSIVGLSGSKTVPAEAVSPSG